MLAVNLMPGRRTCAFRNHFWKELHIESHIDLTLWGESDGAMAVMPVWSLSNSADSKQSAALEESDAETIALCWGGTPMPGER